MPSYNSTHTGPQIDNFIVNSANELINLIYPVGAIYISTVATNPGTLFGIGTWERIEDKFLLCAGTTYSGGAMGGAATINLQHSHSTNTGTTGGPSNNTSGGPSVASTGEPSNNTSGAPSNNTSGSTAITVAQMPSHNHGSTGDHTHIIHRSGFGNLMLSGGTGTGGGSITNWGNETVKGWANCLVAASSGAHTHASQGSGQGHTHTLSSHTHTLNSHTHTLSSHTHSQVSVGTNNQLSATQSILPPYIAVYVWKRTA